MKLAQGQIWKKGEDFIRIVQWARLCIQYKLMKNPDSKEGTLHDVTKKEFCRFLKGATLLTPAMLAEEKRIREAESLSTVAVVEEQLESLT